MGFTDEDAAFAASCIINALLLNFTFFVIMWITFDLVHYSVLYEDGQSLQYMPEIIKTSFLSCCSSCNGSLSKKKKVLPITCRSSDHTEKTFYRCLVSSAPCS